MIDIQLQLWLRLRAFFEAALDGKKVLETDMAFNFLIPQIWIADIYNGKCCGWRLAQVHVIVF